MLVYDGYGYVENRQSSKNIFWRCSRYMKYHCRARVVTSKDPNSNEIRILDHKHTHGPANETVRYILQLDDSDFSEKVSKIDDEEEDREWVVESQEF